MPEPPWAQAVDGLRVGDHAIILYNDLAGLGKPLVRFIANGLRANELVVVAIPVRELASWREFLEESLRHVEQNDSAGCLQILPLLPSRITADTGPGDMLPLVRRILKDAEAEGRTGVRVIGRLSPALLDGGFEANAVAIEKYVTAQKIPMRILCVYEATALTRRPVEIVEQIVAAHSPSIAHVTEDVYLVEAAG